MSEPSRHPDLAGKESWKRSARLGCDCHPGAGARESERERGGRKRGGWRGGPGRRGGREGGATGAPASGRGSRGGRGRGRGAPGGRVGCGRPEVPASPPTDYTPGRRSFRRAQGVRILNFQLSILAGPLRSQKQSPPVQRTRGKKRKQKGEGETQPGRARRAEERARQSQPEARGKPARRRRGPESGSRGPRSGSRGQPEARCPPARPRRAPPGSLAAAARRASCPCVAMSYPQGYLYQPSASLALYSCPAYSTSVISGPRTDELGRSSSGSAFSPYAGSTAFTAPSPGYNSHLQYGADPAAAAAAAFSSYVVSEREPRRARAAGAARGGRGLRRTRALAPPRAAPAKLRGPCKLGRLSCTASPGPRAH